MKIEIKPTSRPYEYFHTVKIGFANFAYKTYLAKIIDNNEKHNSQIWTYALKCVRQKCASPR